MKFLIILLFGFILFSCSKGECECVDTVKNDGVIINSNTTTSESEDSHYCELNRGSADTVNGVWVVTNHTCSYTP